MCLATNYTMKIYLCCFSLSQAAPSATPSSIPASEVDKQTEARPSAILADDAALPSSIPNTNDGHVVPPALSKGFGFFSYIVLLVVVIIGGFLTWWLCLGRVVKRFIARRRSRDHYRRVDDNEEK